MGTTDNSAMGIVLALVALSVAIFVAGIVARRRGMLRSRGLLVLWAVIALLPLFGTGLALFTKHQVEYATGETKSGVDEAPVQ